MRRLICLWLFLLALPTLAADRPNVILIITDDQGYGDISAHGNTILKTPNLDALHAKSIRLTDYHVDPTCSPTRSALMSGRYSTRTGVWHTINGRSMMHSDEYTLAEYFRDNGYNTAMFGKWHLGDNAPCRPQDQGFEHVVWHKGGGITQGPDYFGNDYFDDTYDVNGKWQKFEGYCTDVFFRESMKYIDEAKKKDEPFFIYLSTNAPHGPFLVDEKYSKPYKNLGVPGDAAPFYGMIANIDENVGKLRAYLDEQGMAENTLLIFTTDNGTARGSFKPTKEKVSIKGFNAGMRGNKGSKYDGGHRVPFFIHWPGGGLNKGRDLDLLTQHIDILPTLGELVGIKASADNKLKRGAIDGRSFAPMITGRATVEPTDTRFVHSQRVHLPQKWRNAAVMTERWRLTGSKELYDIEKDPGQSNNVADKHPDVVEQLLGDYDQWWDSLKPIFNDVVRYDLGGAENPTTLMSHDWLVKEKQAPWHQNHVNKNALINGPFMVNIVKRGMYRITPMRWPEYVDKPSGVVESSVQAAHFKDGKQVWEFSSIGKKQDPDEAINYSHSLVLYPGPAQLTAILKREDGKTFGAYFLKIEYLGDHKPEKE